MPFHKILIANRGEIAVRIIRTAQNMGYGTVAVFSDADADAPHVALADQAVRLGAAEPAQSYLNMERILAAARLAGADAIHPGYGFLAENADFADAVIAAGLVWIGPPPAAMRVMGNKTAAKQAIAAANVPILPGYAGEQGDSAFIAAATSLGYPVMVKAAAGGGGRGMRLVHKAEAMPLALAAARSEARQAFASDELLLEKAIINPRHVEVQVFGDQQGHVVHLGERDCSIQRRHQKVVEESPSPAVSPELREALGKAAVSVAQAVGYYGAGTVEFLLDEAGQFYFIEMNTRLQVEHPVTEMVTGLDLVAWQLLVAAGEPLPLTQAEIQLNGHAIEVRLYAEDPTNHFLPSTGPVFLWQPPQGEGVRVDHGLRTGMAITPFYDSMVAKIITWGETRAMARRRLGRALAATAVFGPTTNRSFLMQTAVHPTFIKGAATTNFIADTWPPAEEQTPPPILEALAGLLFYRRNDRLVGHGVDSLNLGGRSFTCCFQERQAVRVTAVAPQQYHIQTSSGVFDIQAIAQSQNSVRFEHDSLQASVVYDFEENGRLWLQYGVHTVTFTDILLSPPENRDTVSNGQVLAPMPGVIRHIAVQVGSIVATGQTLLTLEAMKMEHNITAPLPGIITEILVQTGQQMKPRELLVVITPRNEG
ncbi:MAG: acetyl-CoA carboxylase biotin carboxylase subunit [Ardenticatenaceae bacterium]|nr:acetyl-CoA carboxylase biotin carboxylase subunit [Ardenticatenaceae bacterium]